MKKTKSQYNVYQPIVDMMTGVALFFFFLAIVIAGTIVVSNQNNPNRVSSMTGNYTIPYEKFYTEEQYERLYSRGTIYFDYAQISLLEDTQELIEKREEYCEKLKDEVNKSMEKEIVSTSKETTSLVVNAETYFKLGSSKLKPEGVLFARKLGKVLSDAIDKKYEESIPIEAVEIIGHTDNLGSYWYNTQLGCERAYTFVNEMLIGIVEDRTGKAISMSKVQSTDSSEAAGIVNKYGPFFKPSGMSMFEPQKGSVQTKGSKAERDQNRRIEIRIHFEQSDLIDVIAKFDEEKKKLREREDLVKGNQ